MFENRTLHLVLAALIVAVAAVLVVTTGDSWAVRFVVALLALDVSVRLIKTGRRTV